MGEGDDNEHLEADVWAAVVERARHLDLRLHLLHVQLLLLGGGLDEGQVFGRQDFEDELKVLP